MSSYLPKKIARCVFRAFEKVAVRGLRKRVHSTTRMQISSSFDYSVHLYVANHIGEAGQLANLQEFLCNPAFGRSKSCPSLPSTGKLRRRTAGLSYRRGASSFVATSVTTPSSCDSSWHRCRVLLGVVKDSTCYHETVFRSPI